MFHRVGCCGSHWPHGPRRPLRTPEARGWRIAKTTRKEGPGTSGTWPYFLPGRGRGPGLPHAPDPPPSQDTPPKPAVRGLRRGSVCVMVCGTEAEGMWTRISIPANCRVPGMLLRRMARMSGFCCSSAAAGWPTSSCGRPGLPGGGPPFRRRDLVHLARAGADVARQAEREETVPLEPGTCVSIPAGTHFQFRSTSAGRSPRSVSRCHPGRARMRRMRSLAHGPRTRSARLPDGARGIVRRPSGCPRTRRLPP